MSIEKEHRECNVSVVGEMPQLHKAHVYCNDHDVAFTTEYHQVIGENGQ